jgi:hypothetical protein
MQTKRDLFQARNGQTNLRYEIVAQFPIKALRDRDAFPTTKDTRAPTRCSVFFRDRNARSLSADRL